MHFQFTSDLTFAGFAAASTRGRDKAPVVFREFLTSDDGELLCQRLEQFWSGLQERAAAALPDASSVTELVVIWRNGQPCDVWVNEGRQIVEIMARRSVEKGAPVFEDDIADVRRVWFEDIPAPPADCGYFILLPAGFRRTLLFDFGPLLLGVPVDEHRDVPRLLGAAFAAIRFRSRLALTEADWESVFAQGWFPFIGLPRTAVDRLVSHVRAGWPLDEIVPEARAAVGALLPELRSQIQSTALFERHRAVLLQSLDAYARGDYALCASALYPRIEGLLREHHAGRSPGKVKFQLLAQSLVDGKGHHPYALLLPHWFSQYLSRVFFRPEDFDVPSAVKHVSRHSVAHGVIAADHLGEKEAVLAVLMIDHLRFLLSKA